MTQDGNEIKDLLLQVKSNSSAFSIYNRFKTKLCFDEFTVHQAHVFELVPAFIHCSQPEIFSLKDEEEVSIPIGIKGYKLGQNAQNLLKKYFGKKERFNPVGNTAQPPIEFLSLMGSVGSIAYTDKSDFDYWCCVREDLSEEDSENLQKKLERIEVWCDEVMGVEVHFFITTATKLAQNDFGEVSKESCGSALGKLLKEEYYRGSLLVAGKIPFWWVLPLGLDDQAYKGSLHDLLGENPALSNDYIDIGNIHMIPQEEFLGGGLWQLNKGVDSIFKSILKMALLVEYSDPTSDKTLLATVLKREVFANPSDMEFLDPYQNMIDRVLGYYEKLNHLGFLELLRRCFFMKINIKVSHKLASPNRPERNAEAVMVEYCKEWGWSAKDLGKWEYFSDLSLRETIEFKAQAEKFLLKSLKVLKSRVDAKAIKKVMSVHDLKMLLNRLSAVFDQSRKRVEWFFPPFKNAVKAKAYTIQYTEEGTWRLYRDVHDPTKQFGDFENKSFIAEYIYIGRLITWLIYNGLIEYKVKICCALPFSEQLSYNIKSLSEQYKNFIGSPKIPSLNDSSFASQPKAKKWLFCVNLIPPSSSEEFVSSVGVIPKDDADFRGIFDTEDDPFLPTPEVDRGDISETKIVHVLQGLEYKSGSKTTDKREPQTVVTEIINTAAEMNAQRMKCKVLAPEEDPFNAGLERRSLLRDLYLIEKNNWGEVRVFQFHYHSWLAESIVYLLSQGLNDDSIDLDALDYFVGQDFYDPLRFKQRIRQLLVASLTFFSKTKIKAKKEELTPVFCFYCSGRAFFIFFARGQYHYKEFIDMRHGFIAMNIRFKKRIAYSFDQGNNLSDFFQKALDHTPDKKAHICFRKTSQYVDFIAIDELGHICVNRIARDSMRAYFPRIVYSFSLCSKKAIKVQAIQGFSPRPSSTIVTWLEIDDQGNEHLEDITANILIVVPPAIKRLAEASVTMHEESYVDFMRHFAHTGTYSFATDQAKADFRKVIESLMELRQKDSSKQGYRVFLSDFHIKSEDYEVLANNACFLLNMKTLIESACGKVFNKK
ncbi:MAG: class I adenylate cyclase [Planctomycetes bacterium]|nr:class I adenylate cyclase [Planctomycetota bacterium]